MDIKFGTDGWRAIVADEYTVDNLKRVASATALWLKENNRNPVVVIGYDCRFGGKMFADVSARVMGNYGIKTYLDETFASTPMISLATKQLKANAGIVITASHNPPEYNGFKIKAYYGGPALPDMIDEVEALLPETYDEPLLSLQEMKKQGLLEYVSFHDMYYEHAKAHFDLDAINKSGITVAFDAMYGASQNIFKRLVPGAVLHRCEFNPSFKNVAPEPITKNLKSFARLIRQDENIDIGIANDGDGDRIGVLDDNGNFVDSHHLILMLIQYLVKHKGLKGKVIHSFSCTSKIVQLCKKYGLENKVTKIGFKYIAGHMIQERTLIGAEESGGIALATHIPERDGVWVGLTLLEFMSKTHLKLDELTEKLYDEIGSFHVDRNDLKVSEGQKARILENCEGGHYQQFGEYKVEDTETIDGFKYLLGNDRWVMIRPSGTEPVLRVYAEASDKEEVDKILTATIETILKGNDE